MKIMVKVELGMFKGVLPGSRVKEIEVENLAIAYRDMMESNARMRESGHDIHFSFAKGGDLDAE